MFANVPGCLHSRGTIDGSMQRFVDCCPSDTIPQAVSYSIAPPRFQERRPASG